MKKLVLMFVAFVAISFASCGNETRAIPGSDSDSVVVDTLDSLADSVATDSVNLK